MTPDECKPVVDALIFAADTPISLKKIQQILQEVSVDEVPLSMLKAVIEDLHRDNREPQRGFFLQEVAGGYQYRTRPNYARWVKKLMKVKPFRLTQSTLETLAIIAYRQPVIRADIEQIRGVDSGGVLKNLLERGIVKIVGRRNMPGRPFLFGTTKKFLEIFGLEKLSDLPSLRDITELDDASLPTILREHTSGTLIEIDNDGDDADQDGDAGPGERAAEVSLPGPCGVEEPARGTEPQQSDVPADEPSVETSEPAPEVSSMESRDAPPDEPMPGASTATPVPPSGDTP